VTADEPGAGACHLTARSLRDAVEAAGFRVRDTETVPGPFPIGHLAARLDWARMRGLG